MDHGYAYFAFLGASQASNETLPSISPLQLEEDNVTDIVDVDWVQVAQVADSPEAQWVQDVPVQNEQEVQWVRDIPVSEPSVNDASANNGN